MTSTRCALIVGALVLVLAACGGGDAEPAPAAERSVATSTTLDPEPAEAVPPAANSDAVDADEPAAPDLPSDPAGVIAATVLIASGGDLEAAILAGLVSEDDAEAALAALELGDITSVVGG